MGPFGEMMDGLMGMGESSQDSRSCIADKTSFAGKRYRRTALMRDDCVQAAM